jgi:hypothetical protein
MEQNIKSFGGIKQIIKKMGRGEFLKKEKMGEGK